MLVMGYKDELGYGIAVSIWLYTRGVDFPGSICCAVVGVMYDGEMS